MDLDDDLLRELGYAHVDVDMLGVAADVFEVSEECPVCGQTFLATRGLRGRPQLHCSPRCARIAARRAYRQRLRGISIAA